MACFNPKKGFPCYLTKDGKVGLKILPYDCQGLDAKNQPVFTVGDIEQSSYFEIPCGHCLGCRQDQARDWSNRLVMEMQYHDSAYFITLTYDECHIPMIPSLDQNTGEVVWKGNLVKSDIQDFIKSLRYYRPEDHIRYYIAGEYGPQTERPHYHGIIFGLHIGSQVRQTRKGPKVLPAWNLIENGHSETGQIYYDCAELASIWRNGFVSIEPANEYTCKYVCSYVTSKIGEAAAEQYWKDRGQQAPFALQSRRPGIGRKFYEAHESEFFDYEEVYLSTDNGSVPVKPPRYFKKLMAATDEEKYLEYRDRHLRNMEFADELKADVTDLSKIQQIKVLEYNKKQKQKVRNKL